MRQYCSGGSRIWSSIQPLLGVWSSGWLRKKRTGPRARGPGPPRRWPRRPPRCARRPGRRPRSRSRRRRTAGRPPRPAGTPVPRGGRRRRRSGSRWRRGRRRRRRPRRRDGRPGPRPCPRRAPGWRPRGGGRRGQDLLLVLGIDAGGEAVCHQSRAPQRSPGSVTTRRSRRPASHPHPRARRTPASIWSRSAAVAERAPWASPGHGDRSSCTAPGRSTGGRRRRARFTGTGPGRFVPGLTGLPVDEDPRPVARWRGGCGGS